AYFHLGLSFARQGNAAEALHAFERALALDPEDPRRDWVAHYRSTLQAQVQGNFYVLMIGVNFRGQGAFPGHLRFLRQLLMGKYGVPKETIWGLVNKEATYQGVLTAFAKLRQTVTQSDTVFIYYSGNSLPEHWESCLELSDTSYPFSDEAVNALSARDLHSFIDSLPTNRKTLAGVMPNRRLFNLASNSRRYALLARASLGQQDWNHTFEDGIRTSLFVHSFFQQLSHEKTSVQETTYGEVIAGMQATAKATGLDQTPLFMGDANRLLFSGTSTDLTLFDILERANFAALSSATIRQEYAGLEQLAIVFPQAYHGFGRAFLAKGLCSEALAALQKADAQTVADPSLVLELAMAQLGQDDIQAAVQYLTRYLEKPLP
ncbi:MAG: tetratricopeptide repeat protein, partial [Caldilineaceae bacterium]|nr:tetratricopeptide repeat protein [Caldilineaceae bacterium]